MILAAGKGTRLGNLTNNTPKALLPIEDIPVIHYQLLWLKTHGISDVAINLHHCGEKIKDAVGDGSRFEMNIRYSPEETLLGTGGGIKRMEAFFGNTFFVVYGDVLTNFNLQEMILFHQKQQTLATLALIERSNLKDIGIVRINEQCRLTGFEEKPSRHPVKGEFVNSGIYLLNREIFDYIPEESSCDLASDLFPKLIEADLPLYGYLLKPEDYLIDIGTIDNYRQANLDIKTGKAKLIA